LSAEVRTAPEFLGGIGVSLVSVARFERALERFPRRLCRRLFSPAELEYAGTQQHRAQNLAGRFALKCATRRALAARGDRGIFLREIEVTRGALGEPRLRLASIPLGPNLVSLTHDRCFAVASIWLGRASQARSTRRLADE